MSKATKLIAPVLEKFSALASLKERDVGEYAKIRKNGMTFNIHAYELEGLGYISTVEMSAMLGLMKMDTFIFTPVYRDAPLFSFDRILAMGNDTLMLEMYDLCIGQHVDLSDIDAVVKTLSDLPDKPLETRWYDYLQLPQTICKCSKNVDARYVKAVYDYTDAYIQALKASAECERGEKLGKIAFYVDGLFTKGSPTVEQFNKLLGQEKAWDLYRRFVFSSRPE